MEQEQQLAQDRLQMIEETISKAREQFTENGRDYLFWGWLTVITCAIHYALLQFTHTNLHWLPWPIIMSIGGIYTFVYHAVKGKNQKATSYLQLFMGWLWGISAIGFFGLAALCIYHEIIPFSFMLLMAGMTTLISGGVLKYPPLILGGISFFVFAAVSLFVPGVTQIILFAVAIILGYLVPGYMLKAAAK
jgi:hypothetical protein